MGSPFLIADGDGWHLRGMACGQCGERSFPVRTYCPFCGSSTFHEVPFTGWGEVWAMTVVRTRAPGGLEPPYGVGYVKLDEGPVVPAYFGTLESALPPGTPATAMAWDSPSGPLYRFRTLPTKGSEAT